MEIFKGIGQNKTFVTVSKEVTREEALKIANTHFKTTKDKLFVQSGRIEGDYLYLEKGDVWVVSKKEKL